MARKGNLGSLAAERLKAAILRGEYVVGQPLRENELCRVLGASRIPVREALHQLVGEGLVEIRPNRGASVTNPSSDEVREIAEVCRLLETNLLKLAVPSLLPDRLKRAEACLDELDGIDDPMEWTRANWRFHTTLYEAAERPLTIEFLASLRARGDRAALLLASDEKLRQRLNHEHRFILTSARQGRAELASALLSTHLQGGRDAVLRLMTR